MVQKDGVDICYTALQRTEDWLGRGEAILCLRLSLLPAQEIPTQSEGQMTYCRKLAGENVYLFKILQNLGAGVFHFLKVVL